MHDITIGGSVVLKEIRTSSHVVRIRHKTQRVKLIAYHNLGEHKSSSEKSSASSSPSSLSTHVTAILSLIKFVSFEEL